MAARTLYELGDQQRAVLEAVWQGGGATVREVWTRLSPDRSLAYTSVLSVMQKLEKAGWLRHERRGRSYVYRPARPRGAARLEALERFIDRVYDGDASALRVEVRSRTSSRGVVPHPSLKSLVDHRRGAA